jgi:small-conductance mechanosensitive channel
MAAAHAVTAASTQQWVGAGISLAIALILVWILRVLFSRRARKLASSVLRGEISPEVDTRLRLLERFIYAVILCLGVAAALSKFDTVRSIGRALLTSGAIAAAVIGFAARQTLANVVAGVMIAISQPLRIGDWVEFEGNYGVVEDITLSYTLVRTGADQRYVIPNERLAAGILRNDSLVSAPVSVEASVWIPPTADAARAARLLEGTGTTVSVAESTPEGVRLSVSGAAVAPGERAGREAELRARSLERLRAGGLLSS